MHVCTCSGRPRQANVSGTHALCRATAPHGHLYRARPKVLGGRDNGRQRLRTRAATRTGICGELLPAAAAAPAAPATAADADADALAAAAAGATAMFCNPLHATSVLGDAYLCCIQLLPATSPPTSTLPASLSAYLPACLLQMGRVTGMCIICLDDANA